MNNDVIQNIPCNKIEQLEGLMLQQKQVEIPEAHHFSDGLWCKQILIPKGTLAIGHAHTEEFLEIVSKGMMIMFSTGKEPQIVKAPYTGKGMPFRRKVGYAIEDTIWSTFHPNPENEQDPEKLEDRIVIKSDTWELYKDAEEFVFEHDDIPKLLEQLSEEVTK